MRKLFIGLLVLSLFAPPAWAEENRFPGLMDKGIQAMMAKRYQEAAGLFEQAADLEKQNPDAWMLLGTALNRTGDYRRASEALDRARALGSESSDLLWEIGRSRLGQGMYREALEMFQQDIELHSWRADSYLYAGICLQGLGEHEEAVEMFRDCTSKDVNLMPLAYQRMGLSLAAMKKLDEAEAAFRQVGNLPAPEGVDPASEAIQSQIRQSRVAAGRLRALKPREWYASISLGAEHSNNVLSLSKDTLLPENISSTHDESLFMIVQGGYQLHRTNRSQLWLTGMAYANTYFELDDMDFQQFTPGLDFTFLPAERWSLRSNVAYSHFRIDEETSSDSLSLYQGASYSWRDDLTTTFDYGVSFTDFDDDTTSAENRDGSYHNLRVLQGFLFRKWNSVLSLGGRYGWNNTKGEQFDSDSYGFLGSLVHDFVWETRLRYDFSYTRTTFDALSSRAEPAFSHRRKEHTYYPALTWAKWFSRFWQASLTFSFVENDSNIAVYDFDKYTISASATYTF